VEIPEVVSVSDARARLSRILTDLSESGADADPVLIGAHRKPQGVLLSVEAFAALSGRAARSAAVASDTGSIEAEDLPPEAHTVSRRVLSSLESMERDAIVRSLLDARGNKVKAARALGMSRATIYRKIHEYGIVSPV